MNSVADRFVLWQARGTRSLSVAWMLAQREIASDLRVSRMSLVWPLISPVAYTALMVFLKPLLGGTARESPGTFAVFVFVGFSLYQTWYEALRTQMDAIRKNKALMARAELGPGTLFLSTTMLAGVNLLPRMVLACIGALIVLSPSASSLFVLLLGALCVLINGAVIGAMLQPFATLSPDLGKAVQSISLGLLMTGAVFFMLPPSPSPTILWMVSLNPLGALLNATRAPLMGHELVVPLASMVWAGLTVLMLAVVLAIGKRLLPILIERLGS